MSTLSSPNWRRWTDNGGLWNLFSWFGRSADQLAGLLLSPIVLVVFARSVETDPAQISWFIGVFGVGWAVGYALAPFLQYLTVRVMPWIVGGYIVRTASVVLLAFAVSERTADSDQRFRSALICYGAYAVATGIARSAQARHIVHGSAHGLWDNTSVLTTIATQLVISLGALSLWSVLSETELPWSQAFGRIWYLAALALGIATLAAVQQSAHLPEVPRTESRLKDRVDPLPAEHRRLWTGLTIAIGASTILFVEGLAFLAIFEDFRRQSILVRGSIGFFAGGWVAGAVLWGALRSRYPANLLAQFSLGLTMTGLLVSISLADLAGGEWFPETIRGQDSVAVLIYAMAALIGGGLSGRRYMLNPLFEQLESSLRIRIGLSLIAAVAPVVFAFAMRDIQIRTTLGIGLGLCLATVVALGSWDRSGASRRPRHIDQAGLGSHLAVR